MKKGCSFVFAVVFVVSMLLMPVSAEVPSSLAGNLVSSVDYRTESPLDITGNLEYDSDNTPEEDIVYYQFDGILGVNHDSFSGHGLRLNYIEDNYQTLDHVFTIEAYVYLTEEAFLMPIEFWWGGEEPEFGRLIWDGTRFGFGQSEDGDINEIVLEDEDRDLETGWYHVVASCDGSNLNLYVNGELSGSGSYSGGMYGLWYYWVAKTDFPAYAIGYINIYNVTASEEQVKMMYDPEYAPATTEAPVTTGTSENSPSATNNSTPAPTQAPQQSNAETFDMGIVSLAAAAFSSLAAIRKRKSHK